MKTKFLKPFVATGMASIAMLLSSLTASATIITATLDTDFSGPQNATVFPVVTFDDMDTAGSVQLTVDISALDTANKISDLWFNFAGDATLLSFINEVGPATSSRLTCNNCNTLGPMGHFRPDGDGFFDVHFAWPTADATAFSGGSIYQIDLTLAGITANDFNLVSIAPENAESNSFHCVAVHLQGLGPGDDSDHLGASTCEVGTGGGGGGGGSTDIAEPGTLALFGLGLTGLAFARRKKAA